MSRPTGGGNFFKGVDDSKLWRVFLADNEDLRTLYGSLVSFNNKIKVIKEGQETQAGQPDKQDKKRGRSSGTGQGSGMMGGDGRASGSAPSRIAASGAAGKGSQNATGRDRGGSALPTQKAVGANSLATEVLDMTQPEAAPEPERGKQRQAAPKSKRQAAAAAAAAAAAPGDGAAAPASTDMQFQLARKRLKHNEASAAPEAGGAGPSTGDDQWKHEVRSLIASLNQTVQTFSGLVTSVLEEWHTSSLQPQILQKLTEMVERQDYVVELLSRDQDIVPETEQK
jgi:hypothetical protein